MMGPMKPREVLSLSRFEHFCTFPVLQFHISECLLYRNLDHYSVTQSLEMWRQDVVTFFSLVSLGLGSSTSHG